MRRPTTQRSGHALLGTMAFLTLAMLMWVAAFAQVSGCLRAAKAFELRHDRSEGPTRALAWGLALMETGLPPHAPYSCRVSPGPTETFVVTFCRTSDAEWKLAVRQADGNDQFVPLAPQQFAGIGSDANGNGSGIGGGG